MVLLSPLEASVNFLIYLFSAMRDTNSDEEESDFCASTQRDIADEMDYKTDPVATVIDPRTMNEVDMSKEIHMRYIRKYFQ
jgi:hypothetical protein